MLVCEDREERGVARGDAVREGDGSRAAGAWSVEGENADAVLFREPVKEGSC